MSHSGSLLGAGRRLQRRRDGSPITR